MNSLIIWLIISFYQCKRRYHIDDLGTFHLLWLPGPLFWIIRNLCSLALPLRHPMVFQYLLHRCFEVSAKALSQLDRVSNLLSILLSKSIGRHYHFYRYWDAIFYWGIWLMVVSKDNLMEPYRKRWYTSWHRWKFK